MRNRKLRIEQLESRQLLTAEGELYSFDQTLDASGLGTSVSGSIAWGDGTQSAASVVQAQNGSLRAKVDYRYDTSGFFDAARKQVFETALASVLNRFSDRLSAITPNPTASDNWTVNFKHPATGYTQELANPAIAANEILIFAGARPMPGPRVGDGSYGGFSISRATLGFIETVRSRGQVGVTASSPTDFAPWGGTIAFDSTANWYFGLNESGLTSDKNDFVSVAVHELSHVLGFGTAPSWNTYRSGSSFTGSRSRAAYGGNVPLYVDGQHWSLNLQDDGRETALDPDVTQGTRKLYTPLDLAGLDDIGWDLVANQVRVTGTHTYPDDGRYSIGVTLKGAGQIGSILHVGPALNITNVAPVLTVIGDQTAQAGQVLSLAEIGSISDPGYDNPSATPPTTERFTYSVNWGDRAAVDTGAAIVFQYGNSARPTIAKFGGTHTYASGGSYTVTVTATDDNQGVQSKSFRVTVAAAPTVSLSLSATTIREDAGANAVMLTIRRSGGTLTNPLALQLSSNDTSEATIAGTVTIPANDSSISVPINIVDDSLIDGSQTVPFTVSGSGIAPTTIDLLVTDRETLSAAFSPLIFSESGTTTTLSLTVSNTDRTLPITVNVAGGNSARAQVPATLTIPVGSQKATLVVSAVDNTISDGHQLLLYTFTASGYDAAKAEVIVEDDEKSLFQNPKIASDVDDDGDVIPLDVLLVVNLLNNQVATLLNPVDATGDFLFVDVNGDYRLTPLDALLIINELNKSKPSGELGINGSFKQSELIAPEMVHVWDDTTDEDQELAARDQLFGDLHG